jgi:hypothetical protein
MARAKVPAALVATGAAMEQVSGNAVPGVPPAALAGSASVFKQGKSIDKKDDRHQIAKRWQIECYRHVNICGEARKGVTLYAALAARAEIGISEPQAMNRRAVWVNKGPEVDALAELAPTARDRAALVRTYMTHRIIAGECYLIARDRHEQDPEYLTKRTVPVWEIVAVTELRRIGDLWQVRLDNDNYVDLAASDPIIRMWVPDPEKRREAWSPMRSLLPVLQEIEWFTGHIFTQIRSRLMSAGVWFLPEHLVFPTPTPDMVEGGEEALAQMNEAEKLMVALAAAGTYELDASEVSFPTVVMTDAQALEQVDQNKLIKFWSEIDNKAMEGRSDAIRRLALGWDLTPEQLLGSSGIAVTGGGGSAGSVNHWGEWANEEKTIAGHIEPALSDFTETLTVSFLRAAVDGTDKVIAYDPSSIRMKQDRSKEALILNERGMLSNETTLREVGFDPEHDMMKPAEFKRWLLVKMLSGSPSPEMMIEAMRLLGQVFEVDMEPTGGGEGGEKGLPGPGQPRNNDDVPVKGPPQVQHDHSPAPYALSAPVFSALHASCEVLVLRALEKAGNRLLNSDIHNKRGKTRDKSTPPHVAHLSASVTTLPEFDFTLLPTALSGVPAGRQARIGGALHRYCARMYSEQAAYTRHDLIEALEGL